MEKTDLLYDFYLGVKERNLGVYGVAVRQNQKILAQYQWRAVERVQLYSASKTFTSMAVGIAADEGFFSLYPCPLSTFRISCFCHRSDVGELHRAESAVHDQWSRCLPAGRRNGLP